MLSDAALLVGYQIGGYHFSTFECLINAMVLMQKKKQWLSHNKKIYISNDICVSGYPNKINFCVIG